MKTAVIYARYSSDKQTEQSIEGQLRVCQEYASRNDIVIIDTYIDRALTGTNDNRKDFQRMIKDSGKKMWDYVLVYKLDRFSRNKYEIATYKKILRDNGAKVLSAMENIPDTPEGIILESLLEGMAEYYSAELSQKVKRGRRESVEKGQYLGGRVPYGYRSENKRLYVDENRAEIVRMIFQKYASGKIVREILEDLNELGVLYNGKPIYQSTLFKILKLEKYTGVYKFNGKIYTNIYPQIVPIPLFEKVQNMMAKNKLGSNSRSADFILKGKLYCGLCGKKINGDSGTSQTGATKHYYTCSSKKRFKKCEKERVRKELIEDLIIDTTIEFLSNPETISSLADEIVKLYNQISREQSLLNILNEEKNKIQHSINNIMKAIEEGIFTSTTKERLTELEASMEEIKAKILNEETKLKFQPKKIDIETYLNNGLKSERKTLIELLIDKVILYNDKIEIYYKYIKSTNPDEALPDIHREFSLFWEIIKITQRNFIVSFEL